MKSAVLANRAVFLDRDGVLNRATIQDGQLRPPSSVADLEILPGVAEALDRLKRARFALIVVTNQPDVARGRIRREDVEAIHTLLRRALPLDAIRVCFHDDADECTCRKPRPGMLLSEAADRGIQLSRSFMVGDRWRDIEAGQHARCRTILISSGIQDERFVVPVPDYTASNLPEAADWILTQ